MSLRREGYRDRLIDGRIAELLKTFGAVSIDGPKWVGKTWTAENHANSEFRMDGRTGPLLNRDIVRNDPEKALAGDPPHLIDEWQEIPTIWDDVRNLVDSSTKKGRIILTGSSVPRRDEYFHSGAGRIARVEMDTMSLYESGDSNGHVRLSSLFDGGFEDHDCGETELRHLIDLVIRGGWPGGIDVDPNGSIRIADEYIPCAIDDACRLDGRNRRQQKMWMLFRSLARNESTLASDSKLMKDMRTFDDESIAIETFYEYHDCLQRIHLIDDIPSFRPNVRSDMRIGKAPKRHLVDVSLAVSALGVTPEMLVDDLNTFGFLFESLCIHDLKIYAEHMGGRLFHYRDGRGREIDAVVELRDGRWGAFDIKVGAGQIDSAAENLLRIRDLMEKEGKPPSVMCVICGMTRYAYRRPDGVYVVPITSMGP